MLVQVFARNVERASAERIRHGDGQPIAAHKWKINLNVDLKRAVAGSVIDDDIRAQRRGEQRCDLQKQERGKDAYSANGQHAPSQCAFSTKNVGWKSLVHVDASER